MSKCKKNILIGITVFLIIIIICGVVKLFYSNKDKDYQKLGLGLDVQDIDYYTVYIQDLFSEYKVYKLNDNFRKMHIDKLKEKLENSTNWNKEKYYEYIMKMFYEKENGKIQEIDRENLYYYHGDEMFAVLDLKNGKLYCYEGIQFYHQDYSKILEIKIDSYMGREIYSVRGGLQHDGIDYYVYKFDAEDGERIVNDIENSDIWNQQKLEDKLLDSFEYNTEVKECINGYYYYKKVRRTSEKYKKDNYTDDEATGYGMGVYDADKNILYYYYLTY